MIISWLSPLFGKLSADATLVGEHFFVKSHPITETPCIIPNNWLIHDHGRKPNDNEDLFGLSA